jgi:hypothetical protein
MLLRGIFAFGVLAPFALGQGTMGDWAMNALLGGSEAQGILLQLNAPILNRPFSASATVHTFHTLEDGTHIDKTTTTLLYRDAQGRRRSETGHVVDIVDPVAGYAITLNAETLTATKREDRYIDTREPASDDADVTRRKVQGKSKKNNALQEIGTDDLGIKVVNGVTAHGVRTSTTIPVGVIGNDRAIKITKEIWTSNDLRLPVKSIDSDPRFGTSTYELTNIVLGAPDASLFSLQQPGRYSRWYPVATPGNVTPGAPTKK